MADGMTAPLGLVGDIGGTNARFALAAEADGRVELIDPQTYRCEDFASADEAAAVYLARHGDPGRPAAAVIAVAGPISDGAASFTNMSWRISETGFAERVKLKRATLINDYAALALSAAVLTPADYHHLGPELPTPPEQTMAIMGAGTGFGASALVAYEGHRAVMTTEGGHIGFAPADELEVEVLRVLSRRFGRVSIERILSGPGLVNLHQALGEIEGREAACESPDEVTALADAGDAGAKLTVERFCAILGSAAGDLALAYGARGSVFLAGGVAARLEAVLQNGGFRRRFEAKGRFQGYMAAIPTKLILRSSGAALLGAARALMRSPCGGLEVQPLAPLGAGPVDPRVTI